MITMRRMARELRTDGLFLSKVLPLVIVVFFSFPLLSQSFCQRRMFPIHKSTKLYELELFFLLLLQAKVSLLLSSLIRAVINE